MESGTLSLCATPIGNLEDISFRVLRTLKEADCIAAEDTRNSIKLLNHFEIKTPMTAYHEFNKVEKARELVARLLKGENIALITDCMTAGGLEDGDYMLGEFPVVVAEGTARLKSTGNLAGSILKLKDGLKNVVKWGIANPHQAVMMASLIPAKSVHIDDVCGQIKEGYDADFIVLDKDLELVATYLDGQERFHV